MKKFPVVLIVLLLMLFAGSASADGKDLYIDGNIQNIFTSEDGLLSTSTQALAQTSEGFIWIGGYGGLVRYDGKHFEPFAYKRLTRVTDLAAGERGILWVATSDKGLFKCDDNTFTAVAGSDAADVECLAFSPDGTLYLGCSDGLRKVVDDEVRRVSIPGLDGENIDRLAIPANDALLCVTGSGKLFAWNGEKLKHVNSSEELSLRSVCSNPAGGYLAGTSGNEVLLLDKDLNITDRLAMEGLSCINDVQCDDQGAMWLCADNGIAVYMDGSLRMQNLKMNNSVDKMFIDREGNHWFVSSRQGALEVSQSQFGDVSQCAGLEDMVVNAIQRIGDTLYIGHDTGLVTIDANDFKKIETHPLSKLESTRVRALLADSHDDLWIGTMKKGLFRYTPGGEIENFTTKTCPELKSDNIRSIRETDLGILVGTDRGAYLVSDDTVANVSNDPGDLDFRILCAEKIGDNLCLGSDGNGLYFLKDGQVVRHVTTDDGLSSNVIMKAYWSETFNGIWLVTGINVDFIDADGNVISIENFPSTNNLDLLFMKNGDVWVFTGCGIYLTTEESLLRDDNPRALQFRRADGLPYDVTPNSYQCLTDDVLFVCGTGGVFSLQTDFSQSELGEYQLVIDNVELDGETVYLKPDDVCNIPGDVKRLAINAYALTYQTGNPFVFYYLEGFDDSETVARLSDIGNITYTNLNGGSYTFHYGIRDYRTGETLQEITLPIVKSFPWYQSPAVQVTVIALALLLILATTLLFLHIRYKRIERSLQKEYEEKEKLHLKRIAYQDFLTDLYNRNYLDVWNSQQPKDGDYPICYVSIDMNNLKKINDRYGHKHGDQLLCEMAGLLKRNFSGDQYTLLRIGGDEFLILGRGVDAETMRARLDHMTAEGQSIHVDGLPVTFAYGLWVQNHGEFNFEEGLRKSDLDMLKAKSLFHGRD